MVVKHCCSGLCTSDSRYPDKLPHGTYFISFTKPGIIRSGMDDWEKRQQHEKLEKAKRWIHAPGRKDITHRTH